MIALVPGWFTCASTMSMSEELGPPTSGRTGLFDPLGSAVDKRSVVHMCAI